MTPSTGHSGRTSRKGDRPMRARLSAAVLSALVFWASGAEAQAPLTAVRVPGAGPIVEPTASVWKQSRPVKVAMLPQTVTPPQKPDTAIKELTVRAVHNGGWVAFLIEWKDPTLSNRIVLDNFGDQVAVQLPLDPKGAVPSPMMGNAGGRVNIMQWRGGLPHDIEGGDAPVPGPLHHPGAP